MTKESVFGADLESEVTPSELFGNIEDGDEDQGDDPEQVEGQSEQAPQGQPVIDPAQMLGEGQSESAEDAVDPTFGGQFKDPVALAKSYRELQKLQGRQGQEVSHLRQQVQQAAQIMTGMQAQYQQYQQLLAQARAGQLPQGAPPQATMQPGQGQAPADPEVWLNNFYENPVEAVKSIIKGELNHEGKALGQALTKVIAPIQKYVAQDVTSKELGRRFTQAQRAIPDFEDLRNDAANVLEAIPELATRPGGLEQAFAIARGYRAQYQGNNQAQSQAQRAAARIPGTSGSRPGQQQTYDDDVRQSVFGNPGKTGGVFG